MSRWGHSCPLGWPRDIWEEGVPQSGGRRTGTSWEPGREGLEMEIGGLDPLSKESRAQGQESQEKLCPGLGEAIVRFPYDFNC